EQLAAPALRRGPHGMRGGRMSGARSRRFCRRRVGRKRSGGESNRGGGNREREGSRTRVDRTLLARTDIEPHPEVLLFLRRPAPWGLAVGLAPRANRVIGWLRALRPPPAPPGDRFAPSERERHAQQWVPRSPGT